EEARKLFDGLPDKKYDNEEFVILVPGDQYGIYASFEIMPDETYYSVLNTNLEKRNSLVEEKFGVKIVEQRTESSQSMVELIRNESLSNTHSFDVATPYIPTAATLAAEGALMDYELLEYIDLDLPCWDQNAKDSLSICNRTYFATGDLNLLAMACTHAIVFNKDLVTEFGLESPYDLVKSGDWTIDKLSEMAKKITADVDGTTGMSYNDRYGFLVNENYVTSMFIGAGQNLVRKDDVDDIPYLSIYNDSTTAANVFSRIFELVNDPTVTGQIDNTSGGYYTSATAAGKSCWNAATESVANKLALFRSMALIDINDLGENYTCSYGILPTPKFDKSQDDYYSFVSTLYATCFVVTSTYEDPERASVIIQALTEASTETAKTAYYERILRDRKIQDYESDDMLDIILNGRVYDLGVIYGWGGTNDYDPDSIGIFMNKIAFSGTQTFASRLEALQGKVEAAMYKVIDDYAEN
ncbi:MAG: extracellular solute-binding protein, partial [Clostridia bacterium]|nr:extracellular solute-binding protein [Clostridia bacterium]